MPLMKLPAVFVMKLSLPYIKMAQQASGTMAVDYLLTLTLPLASPDSRWFLLTYTQEENLVTKIMNIQAVYMV